MLKNKLYLKANKYLTIFFMLFIRQDAERWPDLPCARLPAGPRGAAGASDQPCDQSGQLDVLDPSRQ